MSMLYRSCFRILRIRAAIISALLPLLLLTCAAGWVRAQSGVPPFVLQINRDYTQLPSYTGTPSSGAMFGPDIETQNNRPFIYLKNNSPEAMNDFHLVLPETFGSNLFHFAALPKGLISVKSTSPSGVQVNPSATSAGHELVLSFLGGLQQDQSVTFQVRFASDSCPTCGKPSYQVALFNLCVDGTTMGDPAQVQINFAGGGTFPLTPWSNFAYNPYDEGHYAPLETTPTTNPPQTSTFPTVPTVPEPSGLLLALISLGGMWCSRTRHRRRQVA